MFCPKCGKQNDNRTALYCQACGATLVAQAVPQTVSETGVYAGFWIRFVAAIIDALIISVGAGLVAAGTLGGGFLVGLVGPWLYEAFMLSSDWQATVGKRAMSIAVTGYDGGRISFARATGRHFAKYISGFLLGIGFIMVAFTERKQGLHDMIAETLVVHRAP